MSITVSDLIIGERFNFIGQDERLVYIGRDYRNGLWHRFALVERPTKVWAGARESDLQYFEKTEESQC